MTNQEINEAVARKLGHSEEEMKIWGNDPDYDYCHSIEVASEIVEYLKTTKYCCMQINIDAKGASIWIGTKYKQKCFSEASTVSMAICLAFLKLP